MSNPASTESGSLLPLRPALKDMDSDARSPKSGPAKVVQIAEEEEEIPPLPLSEEASRPKIFTASTAGRRLTGRPTMSGASSSRVSLRSQNSGDEQSASDTAHAEKKQHHVHQHNAQHHPHRHEKFVAQVTEWLQSERANLAAKKARRRGKKGHPPPGEDASAARSRPSMDGSDTEALSLEKLQKILENNMTPFAADQLPDSSASSTTRRPSHSLGQSYSGGRRRSSLKKPTSDTEVQDGEVVVPSCDVILDNSKTMSYTGGAADEGSSLKKAEKEKRAWSGFKLEILKLAHTLKLKGWRGIPLENSDNIEVKRLSGALTNAVYVVAPPPPPPTRPLKASGRPHRIPEKLLLRVYGPQVEHLIDREVELSILRRLARRNIGPRMLGTFKNGRFEQFFNAETLTPEDLRDQAQSKQIAKRMRELHDGVDLLEDERNNGPFVWLNWQKWVKQCEQVTTYLDKEINSGNVGTGELWRSRGLICGVEWPVFRKMVETYRIWLDKAYGADGVRSDLVFAHNDTQYGNILRLIPEEPKEREEPKEKPKPGAEEVSIHKQLIVIDFEYASANTPGLEFANHFTEWCYNYHDEKKSWACNTNNYPTLKQQEAFIRSYVNHRPEYNTKASSTPKMPAIDGTSEESVSELPPLDQETEQPKAPSTKAQYAEEEKVRSEQTEVLVKNLLKQVRLWRVACSAQWVAWGIVQAKVPELEDKHGDIVGEEAAKKIENEEEAEAVKGGETKEEFKQEEKEEAEAEFDYLAYAQDRALFFWGDIVGLGLMKKEDLPEGLRERLKIVEDEES